MVYSRNGACKGYFLNLRSRGPLTEGLPQQGRIRSSDGHNFMDLNHNKFAIGNGASAMDSNKNEKDALTIKGAIV